MRGSFAFLLLAFFFLHSFVIVGGRTYLPPVQFSDEQLPPGRTGPQSATGYTPDPAGSFVVGMGEDSYTNLTLRKGGFPFWDPYHGLGQPFFANGLSAVLSPFRALQIVLPPAFWDLSYLAAWLVAGLFTFLFLRELELSELSAVAGSLGVWVSGYWGLYLPLRELPWAACWWPLLLFVVERTLRDPRWRWRHLVLALGIAATLMGQPETAFVSLVTLVAYILLRAWRRAPAFLPGAILALFLTVPYWLPFLQFALGGATSRSHGEAVGSMHLVTADLVNYFFPYLYGVLYTSPFGGSNQVNWGFGIGWGQGLLLFFAFLACGDLHSRKAGRALAWLTALLALKFWGAPLISVLGKLPFARMVNFPRYGGFALDFGLISLAAVGLDRWRTLDAERAGRWYRAWLAFVLLLFVVAIVPIASRFRTYPNELCLGLSGLGFALLPPWQCLRALRRGSSSATTGLLVVIAVILEGVSHQAYGFSTWNYVNLCVGALIFFGLVSEWLLRGFERSVGWKTPSLVALAIWAVIFNVSASRRFGLAARHNPLPEAPFLSVVAEQSRGGEYRAYSWHGLPQANFAAHYGFSSLAYLAAIVSPQWSHFVTHYIDRSTWDLWLSGYASGSPQTFLPEEEFFVHRRYYDLLGVRTLVTRDQDLERVRSRLISGGRIRGHENRPLVPIHREGQITVWSNSQALPRVFLVSSARLAANWRDAQERLAGLHELSSEAVVENPEALLSGAVGSSPGEVRRFSLSSNALEIEVVTTQPALVVITDTFDPAWRAEVDGKKATLYRVDGLFRGVRLSERGLHSLRLRYRPPFWGGATLVSGLGWFFSALTLVL